MNLYIIYIGATSFSSARFGQGRGAIVMDDVDCTGSEKILMNCTFTVNHDCGHSEDAGVRCVAVQNDSECNYYNSLVWASEYS